MVAVPINSLINTVLVFGVDNTRRLEYTQNGYGVRGVMAPGDGSAFCMAFAGTGTKAKLECPERTFGL